MSPRYERFNALKKRNPNLKTLLAVGGWNMGSAPFTKMVATAESRQDFADHSLTFLKSRGFDGLDLDWEYPANRGSPPEDKKRLTLLVKVRYLAMTLRLCKFEWDHLLSVLFLSLWIKHKTHISGGYFSIYAQAVNK